MTDKTKIHGFTEAGESPPTVVRYGNIWDTRGDPIQRKGRLALISVGIWVCLAYGALVGCVSSTLLLVTQTQHPVIGDTHINPVSVQAAQKGKIYLGFP